MEALSFSCLQGFPKSQEVVQGFVAEGIITPDDISSPGIFQQLGNLHLSYRQKLQTQDLFKIPDKFRQLRLVAINGVRIHYQVEIQQLQGFLEQILECGRGLGIAVESQDAQAGAA
ncbi:hypothetical protein TURU_002273 [Turdus rufiventris]|nr:hypothetical protein TURU_002275 [Turdus rufiventris]KAF4805094.1 hypothetical protein TURU_002273 [Turdus rufiventris]